jgi:hypothetical protein
MAALIFPRWRSGFSARILKAKPKYNHSKLWPKGSEKLIAIFNKSDIHFCTLHERGHIKFFTKKSLGMVLGENGFKVTKFVSFGRIPYIWKSMLVLAQKK